MEPAILTVFNMLVLVVNVAQCILKSVSLESGQHYCF